MITFFDQWPTTRLSAKTQAHLELLADVEGLRPLKCSGWQVVQNLDFNLHRISTDLRKGTYANAKAWHEHFKELGSEDNILARTSKFEVELYRPVCLSFSKNYITFCFLSQPDY